jgi:hypothetical protein
MANLAFCYLSGIGVDKDLDKAYELAFEANERTKQQVALTGTGDKGLYEQLIIVIEGELNKTAGK